MKKLFFGLATSLILCFAASSANAQVQDTTDRQNNGNIEQPTLPTDSIKEDTVNTVTPAPNNPTTSDTTNRNNGVTMPSDINTPDGNNGVTMPSDINTPDGNNGNGNDMSPETRPGTPTTPNTPTTSPGTDPFPRPESDIPNSPRPNTSPNSPTTPTTGSPM